MQIVFVRHGTTAWNKEKRWQGSSDVPLSDVGRAQARVTARYLLEQFEVPEAIYTSDLSRALETSGFIAGEFGKEPIATPLLREAHIGLWSGVEIEESFKTHGRLIQKWRSDPWADMPETESLGELQRRSVGFLKYVEGLYKDGQSIIVVSHALFIKSVLCYVLGMPLQNNYSFNLDNCSISTIRAGEGGTGWRLFELNIHRHLAQVR
ncbi:MAG TPA: histidine phosphatase family protein [Mesotoga sp.]|nr:histidine phosphatase family protein [Mesotoga sp.]HPX23595.1 histidine phosphatase family protein [Mesotoga sp.]HQC57803.1 histidine phosphatase family protein [Mesotoga sp.]